MVVAMKIYVDVVFFINFMYDLYLLMVVSFLLKVHIKLRRFLLGAFLGGLSIFLLFLPISDVLLFFLKIAISIVMILATFSYQNKTLFVKQLGFLYFASFCLGGLLYALNATWSYERQGFLFLQKDTSLNFYLILILGPILFFSYFKRIWNEKKKVALIHFLEFEAFGKKFEVEGYLDTGNQLHDPYRKRGVILLYEKEFTPPLEKTIWVPFKTAEGSGLLSCIVPQNLKVDGKIKKNYLVGFTKSELNLQGRRCILPEQMREELE